jgi:hypothetical protein
VFPSTSSLHDQDVHGRQQESGVVSTTINVKEAGDNTNFSLNNSESNIFSGLALPSYPLGHQPSVLSTTNQVQRAEQEEIENASTKLVSNSLRD